MIASLQTDLVGQRIEMKARGFNDPHVTWTDDRDSSRGDLIGVVRTVATSSDGTILLQIEDAEGWIHTRSSRSHTFRVARCACDDDTKWVRLKDLKVGDCFRFVKPPAGIYDGKLIVVDKAPGWAMAEGWDFFHIWGETMAQYADEEVELLYERAPTPGGPAMPSDWSEKE